MRFIKLVRNNLLTAKCLPLILLALCAACSNTTAPPATSVDPESEPRPANASDYHRDLIYPRETQYFVADGELVIYDDPFYGAAISYVDKRDYPDIITVFVYPIPTTNWNDRDLTLNTEIEAFLTELDNTVNIGAYQSRSQETQSDYTINKNGQSYHGKKVHFEFTNKQGMAFNADAYIFIQKDKFIKIRTSSYKEFTPDWNGDLIADELLPEITVPDESEFMRELRNEHRQ